MLEVKDEHHLDCFFYSLLSNDSLHYIERLQSEHHTTNQKQTTEITAHTYLQQLARPLPSLIATSPS